MKLNQNYRDDDGVFLVMVVVTVFIDVVVVVAVVAIFDDAVDVVVAVVAVVFTVVDFERWFEFEVEVEVDFAWFCCFFGLAGGVFFGDLFDRAVRLELRLLADSLLIAPVLAGTDAIGGNTVAVKLFCLGGEQPK